jgi:L-lactate dehydrogenase complex protein LldG
MSNPSSRERIFARLRTSGTERTTVPDTPLPPDIDLDREGRIARMAELMTAIRTEVHRVAADAWIDKLKEIAAAKEWKRMVYGPGSAVGKQIDAAAASNADGLPRLVAYDEPAEKLKDELFQIDAGITGCLGGVADTGAVVLWPDESEPRLISLVPPVHVAVLDADTIYTSLAEMMRLQNWSLGMPTNVLLISGPSKTADIEFTLVFGVHGPKEMIVLIRE